jgi:hypothetical protein
LGGADRANISGGAAADDDEVVGCRGHKWNEILCGEAVRQKDSPRPFPPSDFPRDFFLSWAIVIPWKSPCP